MSEKSGCGCGKIFGVGCGAVLVLVIIGTLIVVFNFDRLRDSELGQRIASAASDARELVEEAIALSSEVSAEFPMERCSVNLATHWENGERQQTLELSLIDPEVPEDLDEESYAWEVARFAAARFSRIEDVDTVKIGLQGNLGPGISISSTESYRFAVDDLLEPLPAEDAGSATAAVEGAEAAEAGGEPQ